MSDLATYEYGISPVTGLRQDIRVAARDGEPWFVAADVCRVLELGNPHSSIALLDEDEKGVHSMDTPGGQQRMTMVSESGLYSLILRSRKPEAKKFKRWITHEVLPSIRRTGQYQVTEQFEIPQTFAEALELAARQTRQLEAAQAKVVELHPKAQSWDTLADTGADYSVREAGYILNRDPAINTGQRRLFTLLRAWGLIDSGDRPYATHAKHVVLRPRTRPDASGEQVPAKPQVRITVQGLSYLHKRLGGVEPLDFTEEAS